MPSMRHVSKRQPSPKSVQQQTPFPFPVTQHLLVTTASHIYAWDSAGVHTIFRSSKSGIAAAREAKDGSGILAVADKHVVVLHDTKRGQDRSWGLEADENEVRHLEYSADAKSVFLSTNLTADIHRYSIELSKLLAPSRAHASPPVALAVSPTGHLLVSASDNPPVVYLKDLKQNGTPTLIETTASTTAVVKIAFHPERQNIFVLAFRDGTVASYDATKISRNRNGPLGNQEKINAGGISRLVQLHRPTSETTNAPSVSDVAFLPGYKTRAITTGSDGRCRLIDFADGGAVLRTWHAKAPVTSLSILSQKSDGLERKPSSGRSSHVLGGPTSTNNLVAIGRADGKVHIYDSVGLLLDSKMFSDDGEKIISVEWARGSSPRPIAGSIITKDVRQAITLSSAGAANPLTDSTDPVGLSPTQGRVKTNFEHVGLPPELRRPKDTANQSSTGPPRKFTIHPDEIEEGTVRHIPNRDQAKPVVAQGNYLDLFSPTKQPEDVSHQSPVKRLASPPRPRPRLSPQTFIKSPQPTPAGQHSSVAKVRNLALFPSTDSGTDPVSLQSANLEHMISPNAKYKTSSTKKAGRITFEPSLKKPLRTSSPHRVTKPAPNKNAKVLADLRKMSAVHPAQVGGTLAAFVSSKPADAQKEHTLSARESALRFFKRGKNHIETDLDSLNALKAYDHVHKKAHWPDDSNQDSSLEGDIWLTSESEDQTVRRRRRQRKSPARPPARQTSRSRVDSKGTASTVARDVQPLRTEPSPKKANVDSSTEDDMLSAQTHISPSGAFSPSSNDVRDLFPRTSSLSPQKGRRSRKSKPLSPKKPQETLREVAPNFVDGRQPNSPWARAKAKQAKGASSAVMIPERVNEDLSTARDRQGVVEATNSQMRPHCEICLPTQSRVRDLEGEVARLRGEVIAMKAVLRRNGIASPLSMRY